MKTFNAQQHTVHLAIAIVFFSIGFCTLGAETSRAQSYDDYYDGGYGFGGGDTYSDFSYDYGDTYTYNDYLDNGYNTSGGDVYTYNDSAYSYNDYYGNGYGTSGGDVIDNGCCDSTTSFEDRYNGSYNDYYGNGYGTSGGDVIDNGCCDSTTSFEDRYNGSYNDYYGNGYGTSGGDVIDNGCCEAPIVDPVINNVPYAPVEQAPLAYLDDNYYDYYPSYGYDNYGDLYDYGGMYVDYPYTYPVNDYPDYPIHYQPTCTISVDKSSIDDGDSVTLRWTTNAADVSINNGIGDVSRSGTRTISPNSSRMYVMIASGVGGSTWCSTSVQVVEDDNDNVSCDAFTASDTRVNEGDRVTLDWRTTGANDVRINNGVGDVSNDGSERVTIDEDTTFTLTARDGNDIDTCRVTVRVDRDNNNSNDRNAPRCIFNVSDTNIVREQNVVLSWNNERTDRIVLRDSARIIGDSRDDRNLDEDRDAITVSPARSTKYELTVYNGNTHRTCELNVTVGNQAAGVSLAQVPYTGFEAGPVLTAIFYTVLVLWGIIIAYVLVVKKNDAHKKVENNEVAEVTDSHTEEVATAAMIPENLPIADESESYDTLSHDTDVFQLLENRAHEKYALVSSEALRFIAGQGTDTAEMTATLDRVIALAKAQFPKEGDWIVINKERVISLLG